MKNIGTTIACLLVLLTGSAAWGQPAQVSTLVLSVDRLNASGGMVMGPDGMLYVSNYVRENFTFDPNANFGSEIYKVNPETGEVALYADGLNGPFAMAFEPDGNMVVTNLKFSTVSRVTPDGTHNSFLTISGSVTTGIAVAADSSIIVATCAPGGGNAQILKYSPGSITPQVLIEGPACLLSLTLDDEGNIYSSFRSGSIQKTPPEGGSIEVIAFLPEVTHIVYSRADSALYATSLNGDIIRKITLDGQVNVLAGTGSAGTADGPAHLASFTNPSGIAVSEDGTTIYVNQTLSKGVGNPNSIRMISNVLGASLVANEDEADVPEGFMLAQNYPNPFNPATRIGFELPQAQHVTLTVYDLLGRAVATLVDGFKPAGSHEAVFDARALTSGVYVYRLEAEHFSRAKMMTLLK